MVARRDSAERRDSVEHGLRKTKEITAERRESAEHGLRKTKEITFPPSWTRARIDITLWTKAKELVCWVDGQSEAPKAKITTEAEAEELWRIALDDGQLGKVESRTLNIIMDKFMDGEAKSLFSKRLCKEPAPQITISHYKEAQEHRKQANDLKRKVDRLQAENTTLETQAAKVPRLQTELKGTRAELKVATEKLRVKNSDEYQRQYKDMVNLMQAKYDRQGKGHLNRTHIQEFCKDHFGVCFADLVISRIMTVLQDESHPLGVHVSRYGSLYAALNEEKSDMERQQKEKDEEDQRKLQEEKALAQQRAANEAHQEEADRAQMREQEILSHLTRIGCMVGFIAGAAFSAFCMMGTEASLPYMVFCIVCNAIGGMLAGSAATHQCDDSLNHLYNNEELRNRNIHGRYAASVVAAIIGGGLASSAGLMGKGFV